MLLYFLYPIAHHISIFNIFRYITFRTIGAIFTAFLIAFLLGDPFIRWLRRKQKEGQPIRDDGPESHILTKQGTPTMGGGLLLFSLTITTVIWMDLNSVFVWLVLLGTLGFGILGGIDDYLKLTRRSYHGLSGRHKLIVQFLLSFTVTWFFTRYAPPVYATHLMIPFLKGFSIDLGLFFFIWAGLVIVGSSNAVNLTDGLDGLAIGPVMIAAACFCLISYLVGHAVFAHYLQLSYIPGTGELSVFLGALIGAGLGFLWFNAPPAKVFMGDTGSLASGAALGMIGFITKHEIVLVIVGGLFVLEAVSVILQVGYFKLTGGRRIFLMAPIHHHFEKKGWAEPTIVIRFWVIAILLALLGLSTLKIR